MDLNITNTLFLFGMLQCILMMILIIKNRKWRSVENVILLSLLSVLLASMVPPFVGNSKLVLRYDFLRFIPLYLILFVFPLVYMYVRSIYTEKLTRKDIVAHLATPMLFWGYFTVIWIGSLVVSSVPKGVWATNVGYFTVQILHDATLILFGIGYTIGSIQLIKKAQKRGFYKEQAKFATWIKTLISLLAIGVILQMTAIILGKIYGYWQSNPIDEWLGFSFTLMAKIYNAIILYGISFVAYNSYSSFKRKSKSKRDYEKEMILQIKSQMENDKFFLDKELSLSKFSAQMNISSAQLSDLLNNGYQTTFNDFVNCYRVQEVIQMVETGKNAHLTLEAISENAGFKSKTTFYRAFKKVTAKTPKAYFSTLLTSK